MKRGTLYPLLITSIFVIASVGVFVWAGLGNSEADPSPDMVRISSIADGQKLNLPFVEANLDLPDTLFTVSEQDLAQYNDSNVDSNLNCGLVQHQTNEGNLFWLNYRMNDDCIYETNLPMLANLAEVGNPASLSCSMLTENGNYAACQKLDIPENNINVIMAYTYIPEYIAGDGSGGSFARIYLLRSTFKPNQSILITLIPESINVSQDEFAVFIKSLENSNNDSVFKFLSEINILDGIIHSVRFE